MIYIDQTPFDTRILDSDDDGMLQDLVWQVQGDNPLMGSVFAGRVVRVEPSMAAAFVDIGLERPAFLRAKDARVLLPALPGQKPAKTLPTKNLPIEKLVREGEAVIVQIDREPEGRKGARVSADIRFQGRGGLYYPRREDKTGRGRLKGFFDPKERDRLYTQWDGIIGGQKSPPALLWQDSDPIDHLLRDLHEDESITVVGHALKASLVNRGWPLEQISLTDRLPDDIADQLSAVMQPIVPLEGGGDIVIEPVTALTAIDVNGAGRDALSVNLTAADEIARQIRLRSLGGLIVVDFVSLQNEDQDQALEAAMENALRDDPEQVHITGLSEFGLLEMSRRRRGPALHDRLYHYHPMTGYRLKSRAAAAMIWRTVMMEAQGMTGGKLSLALAPDMVDIWHQGDPATLDQLMRHLGAHVTLQPDAALALDAHKLRY